MITKIFSVISFSFAAFSYAQVGINTTNPLGIFHIDGNKDNTTIPTTTEQANDFIVSSTGSTGIGTTTINSSAKLQIDAANQGVLITRVALQNPTDGITILSPAKGLIVYNTNNSAQIEEGFYVNYGTSSAPLWRTFQKLERSQFVLENTYDVTAVNPVDQNISGGTTINNVNLGMSITVTIPPFSEGKLITSYSVPMGTTTESAGFNGYYGIRFLKNGTELPAGSRKFTIVPASGVVARMVSVNATVGDNVSNNSALPLNITYTLNGYIEATSGSAVNSTIRFNMWAASGANFNWGRGYMSLQMFTKPL